MNQLRLLLILVAAVFFVGCDTSKKYPPRAVAEAPVGFKAASGQIAITPSVVPPEQIKAVSPTATPSPPPCPEPSSSGSSEASY